MIEVHVKDGGATSSVLINPNYIVKMTKDRYLTIAGTGLVDIYQLADIDEYERVRSLLLDFHK